ncbi:MAG TPA: Sec-independent protein translocase protein TatB [Casimicrobiaceae bacterium]|nr:Sec-independent protein translocase protein TatB [Casimicrobiaceae bacterium]
MFDIGFSEIVVIAVVALVVLGPEKLPKTARTLGHLFGRLQRYVNEVKRDIQRELELEELRKLQQNVQSAAKEIEDSMASASRDVERGVRDVEAALGATAEPAQSVASTETPAATPPPPAAPTPAGVTPASSAPEKADAPRQASLPGLDRG